jgi:hypothetical protein
MPRDRRTDVISTWSLSFYFVKNAQWQLNTARGQYLPLGKCNLVTTFGEAKQCLCLCKPYRVLSGLSCCEVSLIFFYCLFVDNFALWWIGIIFGGFCFIWQSEFLGNLFCKYCRSQFPRTSWNSQHISLCQQLNSLCHKPVLVQQMLCNYRCSYVLSTLKCHFKSRINCPVFCPPNKGCHSFLKTNSCTLFLKFTLLKNTITPLKH